LEDLIKTKGINMPVYDSNNPSSITAWRDAPAAMPGEPVGQCEQLLATDFARAIFGKQLSALKLNPAVSSIVRVDPATAVETLIWHR
jgi:hypothetical protein